MLRHQWRAALRRLHDQITRYLLRAASPYVALMFDADYFARYAAFFFSFL